MNIFYYDKTFQGLLCAVFDAYKLKCFPDQILAEGDIQSLFCENVHYVETTNGKYERVGDALKKKLTKNTLNQLTRVWLSETPESATLIFRFICKVFNNKKNIETNFADPDVLAIKKLAEKVSKDEKFLIMFVRFNKTADGVYFSPVAPEYNVLSLILDHFRNRFGDQKWAIYDEKRGYGYFYDLENIVEITLQDADDFLVGSKVNQQYLAEDELKFQKMWTAYFKALTIKERINLKQQRQFMPQRFWHYLPEMQDKIN